MRRASKSLAARLVDDAMRRAVLTAEVGGRWQAARDLVDIKTASRLDAVQLDLLTDWVLERLTG